MFGYSAYPKNSKKFLVNPFNKTKEIPSPFLKLLQFLFQSSGRNTEYQAEKANQNNSRTEKLKEKDQGKNKSMQTRRLLPTVL